jgi:hypothetical protein
VNIDIFFWTIALGVVLSIVAASITIIVGRDRTPQPIPIEDAERD